MTLNQVLRRIKLIVLSHNQVRHFQKSLPQDFFVDHTIKYPAAFLETMPGGSISTARHATTLNYRLYVLDLVHVSEDQGQNEEDVLSDTLSILMDLVAQMNAGDWQDWFLSTDNTLQEQVEYDNDMVAGWYIDFSLRITFTQDRCRVPSDLIIDQNPIDMADKLVYDVKYTATGTEGNTVHIDEIVGKKVLFITMESNPIYKTSSAPDSDEFVWDNTDILFGVTISPLAKILVLYRNY